MSALLDLAARVEAATGADGMYNAELAKLNGDVLRALGWRSAEGDVIDPCGNLVFEVPFVVVSLDAAMTLVPEGCAVDLTIWADKNRARVLPLHQDENGERWLHRGSSPHYVADAATPALALTAAALRALAAIGVKS